jgi:MFS family permease
MAIVAAATLREPRRQMGSDFAGIRAKGPSFADALAEIRGKRTFWLIALGVSVKAFIGYGSGAFIAPFFFRNQGAELTQIAAGYGLGLAGFLGLTLGVAVGLTGAFGIWLGGQLADRFGAKDLRHYMGIPAISTLLGIPIYITALFVESAMLSILLMAVPPILNGLWYGPAYAAIQGLVRPETRATATAIMLFIVNLIGLGMGPLVVGAFSDLLAGPFGLGPAQGVRWSLAISTLSGVFASVLFWKARASIREEMVS